MLKNTTLVYFGVNAIFCIGTKTIISGDQNTISHVRSPRFFVAHSSTVKTDNEQFLMFKNTTLVYFGSNAIFHIGTNTIICICRDLFVGSLQFFARSYDTVESEGPASHWAGNFSLHLLFSSSSSSSSPSPSSSPSSLFIMSIIAIVIIITKSPLCSNCGITPTH